MTKRILLIDSDEPFAQGLSNAMTARGFAATMATNSEQGMTLARKETPDLIVVCVEAQPTNGYMLCTRLKKDEQLKLIPVILTSANATPDSFEKHKKLKTRAEEYLIKPFAPQVMIDKASALLGLAAGGEDAQEEIVSMEDESLGLGDLVAGEDEPIHLSAHEVAEARSADEPMTVDEVEEVVAIDDGEQVAADDDLEMFDQAFDSLGGQRSAAVSNPTERFTGLRAVPEDDGAAVAGTVAGASDEEAPSQDGAGPTELTAPDDDAVLHGLLQDEADGEPLEAAPVHEADSDDLDELLAAKGKELESPRRSPASSGDALKRKDARGRADKEVGRGDKEVLRLQQELDSRERELADLQEKYTALEGEAQELKEESSQRESSAKALQQRADALAAAAKKFERELSAAREELKQLPALQARVAELESASSAHEELADEAERHKARSGELETELESTREKHAGELLQAKSELVTTRHELEGVRAEHDELRRELEEARAQAQLNEERAVKAYQKIKGDEKLREKTRKALQIALQLLEDKGAEDDAREPEKQSA